MTKIKTKAQEIATMLESVDLTIDDLLPVRDDKLLDFLKSAGLTQADIKSANFTMTELKTRIKYKKENNALNNKAYELIKKYRDLNFLLGLILKDIKKREQLGLALCDSEKEAREMEGKLLKEVSNAFYKRIKMEVKKMIFKRKEKIISLIRDSPNPNYAGMNLDDINNGVIEDVTISVIHTIKDRILKKDIRPGDRFIERFDGGEFLFLEIKKCLRVDRDTLYREQRFTYIEKDGSEVKIPVKPYRYLFPMKGIWEKIEGTKNKYKYDVESLAEEFRRNMEIKSIEGKPEPKKIISQFDKNDTIRMIEGMREGWKKIGLERVAIRGESEGNIEQISDNSNEFEEYL